MPWSSHWLELKWRLLYVGLLLLSLYAVLFHERETVLYLLLRPMGETQARTLLFTHLYEAFGTYLKLSFWLTLSLSFPFVLGQGWLFLLPGLFLQERRWWGALLGLSLSLCGLSVWTVYTWLLPPLCTFFQGFETTLGGLFSLHLMPKVSEYVQFVLHLLCFFSIVFQAPVLVVMLWSLHLCSPWGLARQRRWFVALVAILLVFLEPPDPFSHLLLMFPFLVLFESTLWLLFVLDRRKTFFNDGEMAEGLKAADCNSVEVTLRRFESCSLQIYSRRSSSVG